MADKELQILKDKIESLEKVIQGLTGIVTELHTLLTSKEMIKKLEKEEWGRTRVSPSSNPFIYTYGNNTIGPLKSSRSLVGYNTKKRKRMEIWKQ